MVSLLIEKMVNSQERLKKKAMKMQHGIKKRHCNFCNTVNRVIKCIVSGTGIADYFV